MRLSLLFSKTGFHVSRAIAKKSKRRAACLHNSVFKSSRLIFRNSSAVLKRPSQNAVAQAHLQFYPRGSRPNPGRGRRNAGAKQMRKTVFTFTADLEDVRQTIPVCMAFFRKKRLLDPCKMHERGR